MDEYIEREAMRQVLRNASISERFLDELPAADVAPVVHGQWIGEEIDIETSEISATLQECSVCHRVRPVDGYCSHCGAKMGKEKTNGD